MPRFLIVTLLFALAFIASCNRRDETSTPWVIRTYKTDASQGDVSVKTLNKLLNPEPIKSWLYKGDHSEEEVNRVEPSRGVARLAGAGLIAVNTSEEIHKGVPDLLAQIALAKARPLTELQSESWLLVAVPSPKKMALPAALQDKLVAFEKDYPGLCIVEVDHFSLRSVEGKEIHVQGDLTKMKGYLMMAGEKILADLEFDGKLVEFQTQVTTNPGEVMLISQAMRHAKTLPQGVREKCGVAADTPLDLHTLVAIRAAQANSQ